MGIFAIINNNKVVEVKELEEVSYRITAAINDLVLDISDTIPQPQVDWLLQGNKLVPNGAGATAQEITEQIVAKHIIVGKRIKDAAAARLGGRNLILGKTSAEIATFVGQVISIGFLLEGGALRTARSAIEGLKAGYPDYTSELEKVIDEITAFIGP